MESIVEERSEDTELIDKPTNILPLQVFLESAKRYEKHPQNKNRKLSISRKVRDTYYINLKNMKNLLTVVKVPSHLRTIHINY